MGRVAKASIHGRFQPFHNGHLDYALQAFDAADFISIGLTQIFRPRHVEDSEGRYRPEANPLTFQQRSSLIRSALLEAGVAEDRFDVIPFPIETPNRLIEFLSLDVLCFTTQLNRWNAEKIRRLEQVGYKVVKLKVSEIDEVRVATGTTIRSKIRAEDDTWRRLVPPVVFQRIKSEFSGQFLENFEGEESSDSHGMKSRDVERVRSA